MTDRRVQLPGLLAIFPWLTERRVRSMVAERRIPYWKVHGRLLFDPADFQALLDAGYVAPGLDRPPQMTPELPPRGQERDTVAGRSETGRGEGPSAATEGPSSQ